MKRVTTSLPEEMAQALVREARRRNVSASAIARDALARHLGMTGDEPRELPFAAVGRSGQRNTAREMERLTAREWDDPARDR